MFIEIVPVHQTNPVQTVSQPNLWHESYYFTLIYALIHSHPDMLIIIIATGKKKKTACYNACVIIVHLHSNKRLLPQLKKNRFCLKNSHWLVRVKFKHEVRPISFFCFCFFHEIIIESPSCPKACVFLSSVEHKRRYFEEGFNCFCPYN